MQKLLELASPNIDAEDTLKRLADAMDAPNTPEKIQTKEIFDYEEGELNRDNAAMITANLLPENAIVSDESGTSGGSFRYTASASFHDWLIITGGSIGQGLPVAVGAAVAHQVERLFLYKPMVVACIHYKLCGPWRERT